MADRESELNIRFSRDLIERAKKERATLLRQIEESQKTIERSREMIARIDEALAHFKE